MYGDPDVDALIPKAREYFVANYMDGDDGGRVTSDARMMADDVAEIMAVWAVNELGWRPAEKAEAEAPQPQPQPQTEQNDAYARGFKDGWQAGFGQRPVVLPYNPYPYYPYVTPTVTPYTSGPCPYCGRYGAHTCVIS